MKLLWLTSIVFLLSSCASILNNPVQAINISGEKRIHQIRVDSSVRDFRNNNFYYVNRSRQSLRISFKVDSSLKTVYIKSHRSPAFWWNIYFNCGLGMLVDRKKPESYQYKKQIYISAKDSSFRLRSFAPDQKGDVRLHLAMPYANSFHAKTDKGYFSGATFFGFETGIDYFHRADNYFSVYAGAGSGCPIPVPAPLDIRGEFQTASCTYISLRNNHVFNRFELAYGLQYSEFKWIKKNYGDSALASIKKTTNGVGLSLKATYRLGRNFRLFALYQPNLIQLSSKPVIDYQHFFTLGFARKINFRTAKIFLH